MANTDPLNSLLRSAEAGDRSALLDLLICLRPNMVARLLSWAHAGEAEDSFQDALIQVLQKPGLLILKNQEEFQAQLWTIVWRAHKDRCKYYRAGIRDERRTVEDVRQRGADSSQDGLVAGLPGPEETPSKLVWWEERDARLHEEVCKLPDKQRIAIRLHHLELRTVEEVARLMGETKTNVTTLCQRGRDRLREVLTESMRPSVT